MPVYGIVVNKIVSNVINADDISIATPIAKSINPDAFAVELTAGSAEGISWVWDGEKLIAPPAQEQPTSEDIN